RSAGAKPGEPVARPAVPPGDFRAFAAREIDDVVLFDPPRFALSRSRESPIFAFYGTGGTDQVEQVTCERAASFEFVHKANLTGGIRVGVCVKEARRVRELAAASDSAIKSLLGQPGSAGADLAEL